MTARRGYYLLVSSAAALAAVPGLAAYAASKSGVEHFGNALRLELAHKGVAVGVAHPCWIDTDLVRDARDDLGAFDRLRAPARDPSARSPRRGLRGRPGGAHRAAPAQGVRAAQPRPRRGHPAAARAARWPIRPAPRRAATCCRGWNARPPALGRSFGAHSVESPKPG